MARRVLYVAWAPFFSGAERALLLTLRSLDPTRYTPCVLAGTEGEFACQVRALGIPCQVAPLRALDRRQPIAGLMSIAAVLKSAVRHRVSLIHANEAPSFEPAGYAARMMRLPSVTHIRFPDSAKGHGWFLRSGFSRALFVSQALLTHALDQARDVFEGRAEVLHDCVEPQAPWSAEEAIQCRRELDLPEDRVIVAMTGQIAEVKGIWDFVEAARILASRESEPIFVVLGDDLKTEGKTRRAMEDRVSALGLSARFKFLGFRRDAPRMVQAFDIIAVPSHVEPLGNATLEAMAAGRPVVGSRVGGIPEMLVDGETGLLVPPSDPLALANAIARLVHEPALRSAMSLAARGRARETFGIDVHGRHLQAHYDRLCTPGGLRADTGREFASRAQSLDV
jgi:glycosyltransferase involved in cell wall biosynthesis